MVHWPPLLAPGQIQFHNSNFSQEVSVSVANSLEAIGISLEAIAQRFKKHHALWSAQVLIFGVELWKHTSSILTMPTKRTYGTPAATCGTT